MESPEHTELVPETEEMVKSPPQPSKKTPKARQPSKAAQEQDAIDLFVLKEAHVHNPFIFIGSKATSTWTAIAERANTYIARSKLTTVVPRNLRNVKNRVDKLIVNWEASELKDADKSGPAEARKLTELQEFMKKVTEDKKLGHQASSQDVEKAAEEERKVTEIQAKAKQSLSQKNSVGTLDEQEEEIPEYGTQQYFAWEERDGDRLAGLNTDKLYAKDGPASPEDADNNDYSKDLKGKGKRCPSFESPAEKGRKKMRGSVVERMMSEKMKCDKLARELTENNKKTALELELADKEKDREIRRQELAIQAEKMRLEHEFNMKKLELEMTVKDKKYQALATEKQAMANLLSGFPKTQDFYGPK